MSWDAWVEPATKAGFEKVTIVSMADYQIYAATDVKKDIPTSYERDGTKINENQELLDWAMKDGKPKVEFWFYQTQFNVVKWDDDEDSIIAAAEGSTLLGRRFKTLWYLVWAKYGAGCTFETMNHAHSVIKQVWDALDQCGV